MKKQTESDLGKGLTYNLGLFLAHSERKQIELDGKDDYSLWFNGAADHLYEIEIPDKFPSKLKSKIIEFQSKCLRWRLDHATKEDFEWALRKAKDFLMEIDKTLKVDVDKASWE